MSLSRIQKLFSAVPKITRPLMVLAVALVWGASSLTNLAQARPGCVGKMWNPLSDIDFRLMGGMKIAGIPLMKAPKELGEPPQHKVSAVCACKDGLKSGIGLGMTYWLPTYILDIARQGGCVGFLNGLSIGGAGALVLSSGQEYNHHKPGVDGVTSMQAHLAYADIAAIAGKSLFEQCGGLSGALSMVGQTEFDFVWQNDIYSAIMTPQVSILASNAILSQLACGVESIANTLGEWQDFGVCGWKGTRLPLSGSAIAKDMAQVSNMDVVLKYLTRQAMLGVMLRTMGKDVACRPKVDPFYNPFQHRYQWSYPAKVSTRYNVDVVRWGLFIKGGGGGLKTKEADADQVANERPSEKAASGSAQAAAQRIMASLPKPLNYPTREAGYMHVWEAKTCCMMVLTVQNIIQKIIEWVATQGGAFIAQVYEIYTYVDKAYQIIKDPLGGALSMVGDLISDAVSSVGGAIGDAASAVVGAEAVASGASSGIAHSAGL